MADKIWRAAQNWLRLGLSKIKIHVTSEIRLLKSEKSSNHGECLSIEICKY